MKSLKKTMAAMALSLAAAGSAMAQDAPAAPQLNDEEKAVVKLYHDFQACAARKQEEMAAKHEAALAIASEQAKLVADARANAGDAATLGALGSMDLTDEEKTQVLEILKNGETQFFTQILAGKAMSKEKQPGPACLEELNINVEEVQPKIRNLVEKYGPGVLSPQ